MRKPRSSRARFRTCLALASVIGAVGPAFAPALARGANQFGPPGGPPISLDGFPAAIATADFNGDGAPDLAIAEQNGAIVTALHNEVTLRTGHAPDYSLQPPVAQVSQPLQVVTGVFTSSGNEDLAISSYQDSSVTILLGDGQGDFTPAPGSPVSVAGLTSPDAMTVGTFTTGSPDGIAVVANGQVQVIGADPTGTFGVLTQVPAPVSRNADALAAGHFTGTSGLDDVAVLDGATSTVQILQAAGDAGFTPVGSPVATGLPGAACTSSCIEESVSIAAGNFAGSGHTDLAVGSIQGQVAILLGEGNAGFTPALGSPVDAAPPGDQIEQIATGSLGGTPGLDGIATADYFQGGCMEPCTLPADGVSVLLPEGGGRFMPASGSPYADGGVTTTVAVANVDSNGFDDIVFGDGNSCYAPSASTAGENVAFLLNSLTGVTQPAGDYAADGCPIPTPTVTTGPARNIALSGATLTGTVDQHFQTVTDCHFRYGTNPSALTATAGCAFGGPGDLQVTAQVHGLKGLSTYYYQLLASTAGGTNTGAVESVQTCQAPQLPLGPPLPAGAPAQYGTYLTGCFLENPKPKHGDQTWTGSGPVSVNGLTFTAKDGSIRVDPKAQTLDMTSGGTLKLGPLPAFPLPPGFSIDLGRKSDLVPDSKGKFGLNIKGLPVTGTLNLALLPAGEAQVTGTASANIAGNPVELTVVTTFDANGFVGIDAGLGPASTDPLSPSSLLDCNPKDAKVQGFACNEIEIGGTKQWKLTPDYANPQSSSHYLLPLCDPKKPAPIGWSCQPVALPDGSPGPARLVASSPGVVHLGPIGIEDLEFSYTSEHGGQFSGTGLVRIGGILPGGLLSQASGNTALEVKATLNVSPFRFDQGSLGVQNLSLFGGELTNASLSLQLNPRFKISAQVGYTAGPAKTMTFSGGGSLTVQDGDFDLKLNGNAQFETFGFGGSLEVGDPKGSWKVLVSGSISRTVLDVITLEARLSGGFAFNPFGAQLGIDGSATAYGQGISVHGILSTIGWGVCWEVQVLFFSGEIGYQDRWGKPGGPADCDFSGLEPVGSPGGGAADAAAAGVRIRVAPHTSRREFVADGATASPDVVLRAPDGTTYTTPSRPDHLTFVKNAAIVAATAPHVTFFDVAHPAAGMWTFAPAPGQPAPVRYETALPLRPLDLHASVRGSGRLRTLQWRFTPQPGLTVQFVQLGGDPSEPILTTARGRGRVRFRPASGPQARRPLEAVVAIGGISRRTIPLGGFHVVPPAPPRVTHARYQVRSGVATVRWRRARGAVSDTVAVTTSAGTFSYLAAGRSSSMRIVLAGAARLRRVRITATDRLGRSGRAVYAVAPRGRAHRHRHRTKHRRRTHR